MAPQCTKRAVRPAVLPNLGNQLETSRLNAASSPVTPRPAGIYFWLFFYVVFRTPRRAPGGASVSFLFIAPRLQIAESHAVRERFGAGRTCSAYNSAEGVARGGPWLWTWS